MKNYILIPGMLEKSRFNWQLHGILMLMKKGRLHQVKKFDVSDIDMIFSQKERALTKLEEQGVITITVDEEKTAYSFTSSTMERLVIQKLWQTDETWLQAQERSPNSSCDRRTR